MIHLFSRVRVLGTSLVPLYLSVFKGLGVDLCERPDDLARFM